MRGVVFLFFLSQLVFASSNPTGVPQEIPGLIPLFPGQPPATDLFDPQGQPLTPEQADKLYRGRLHLLNPDWSTDIWKNIDPQPADERLDELHLKDHDNVEFISELSASRRENFRFTVSKEIEGKGIKQFIVYVSRTSFNINLRKALLRKLGYSIPSIKRYSNLKINFHNSAEKKLFISHLSNQLLAHPKRWIIEGLEGETPGLTIQDVVVMEAHPNVYNLAVGFIPRSYIRSRRLLNALIVPYELVEVPESVNLFAWKLGRKVNGWLQPNVFTSDDNRRDGLLDFNLFESVYQFQGNYDDAHWIVRRLMKLTRKDFEEIVQAAELPADVSALLVEKLISRRNHIAELFSVSKEFEKLITNHSPTFSPCLRDGKLTCLSWTGYGSLFSYSDPQSPLGSSEEVFAFFKSRLYSNLISNAVFQFNDRVVPHTDLEEKLLDRQVDLISEKFTKFLETGRIEKTSLGIHAIPTVGGNLILSRDVVIGSYLGTDNQIQLADVIGGHIHGGVYLNIEGLSNGLTASVKPQVGISRIYAHLKPIKSVKASLKYPFKNVMVNLFKKKQGNLLDDVVQPGFLNLSEEEKQKIIQRVVKELKENLEIGESLIITDSIIPSVQAAAGYAFTDWVKAVGRFHNGVTLVSRLHLHRFDENTIHVYKDSGVGYPLQISLQLKAFIPVLEVGGFREPAGAKTQFYSINLKTDFKENPKITENLKALRAVFLKNSTEYLSFLQKPYRLNYELEQGGPEFTLLMWKWAGLNTQLKIKVSHEDYPKPIDFYRRVFSQMRGVDYESLSISTVNSIIEELSDSNVFSSSPGTGRPSDTVFGSSIVRSVSVEGRVEQVKNKSFINEPFLRINYAWRGWSKSAKGLAKILEQIKEKTSQALYSSNQFYHLKKILFYDVELNYQIYPEGIQDFLKLSRSRIRNIFDLYSVKPPYLDQHLSPKAASQTKKQHISEAVWKVRKKLLDHESKKDLEKWSKTLTQLFLIFDQYLNLNGLTEMVGGPDNILVQSFIGGFREGMADGDKRLISDTLGTFGRAQSIGPLDEFKRQINVSDPEFYLYWLMRRL